MSEPDSVFTFNNCIFTNLPAVTGDCNDKICESKLREFFITGNKDYPFESSWVSDFLELQINRSDYYSYAADRNVYKLLRKFDFCLKLSLVSGDHIHALFICSATLRSSEWHKL